MPPPSPGKALVTIHPGQYLIDTEYGSHAVEGFGSGGVVEGRETGKGRYFVHAAREGENR